MQNTQAYQIRTTTWYVDEHRQTHVFGEVRGEGGVPISMLPP